MLRIRPDGKVGSGVATLQRKSSVRLRQCDLTRRIQVSRLFFPLQNSRVSLSIPLGTAKRLVARQITRGDGETIPFDATLALVEGIDIYRRSANASFPCIFYIKPIFVVSGASIGNMTRNQVLRYVLIMRSVWRGVG